MTHNKSSLPQSLGSKIVLKACSFLAAILKRALRSKRAERSTPSERGPVGIELAIPNRGLSTSLKSSPHYSSTCFPRWNGWCREMHVKANAEITRSDQCVHLFPIYKHITFKRLLENAQRTGYEGKKEPILQLITNDKSFASKSTFMLRISPIRLWFASPLCSLSLSLFSKSSQLFHTVWSFQQSEHSTNQLLLQMYMTSCILVILI